jgi:hypothetical protein
MTRLGFATAVLALLALARPASAHPVPFSYLDLHVQPDAVEGTIVAHIFDVAHDLGIEKPEQLLDPAVVGQYGSAFADLMARRLEVTIDGRVVAPSWSGAEAVADRQSVRLRVRFPVARSPGVVAVVATLFPYDPTHQTFVNMYEGDALTQAILGQQNPRFEYFSTSRSGAWAIVKRFVPTGIGHILVGADHWLLLIGLLLLGGTAREFLVVVTAFTLANSATLLLAALNYVGTPSRIVEPALALTVVYVGADNLLVKGGRDMRAWIACAFGCIHGLGYANVLRTMGLQRPAVMWSVLPFGVGVEAGQLVVVAVVASIFAVLRKRGAGTRDRLVFAGSIVVAVTGTFLFVQRVFFPGGI